MAPFRSAWVRRSSTSTTVSSPISWVDGVLAYFGYPYAQEDDAERTVRAALDTRRRCSKYQDSPDAALQARIGIATGTGRYEGAAIGESRRSRRGWQDTEPRSAPAGDRRAELAVCPRRTRSLLGNLFELSRISGLTRHEGLCRADAGLGSAGASCVASRFEALHATGLTALVGRDEEFELLLRRWQRAKSGEGQVVLLSGEAGIGKSRLTAALLENLATEPHARLRYFCSPQHTNSALYPIIGQMERAAGLVHDDTPQARLDKLDAVLAQTSTSIEDAALFAEMLSLPNDGRYPALELTPEQRRQRTLDALILQLQALTRSSPVLMIFEDAHWADPTSLEVLSRAVDRIAALRALLIMTFRPEFDPPWIGQPHVTALPINRLAQREVVAIVDHLVGNQELPADVMAEIVERTDGNPLFVEELTKAVLEAESEGDGRRIVATAVPSPGLAVPASLHASLMARLDRLGPAKELAQIGAAIGREFSHALLSALVRKPEAEVESALDRLIAAGLLFRQGVPPHARYLFKHSLVQDVAYGSLLRSKRHQLHAEIAGILESQFRDTIDSQSRAAQRSLQVRREVRPRDPIFDTRRGCRGQPLCILGSHRPLSGGVRHGERVAGLR